MASQPIRAIYQNGQLRLLDAVDLVEGQEVQLVLVDEPDRVDAALADLLVQPLDVEDDIDEEALLKEIEEAFRGQPPLSETIIQERNEGP